MHKIIRWTNSLDKDYDLVACERIGRWTHFGEE